MSEPTKRKEQVQLQDVVFMRDGVLVIDGEGLESILGCDGYVMHGGNGKVFFAPSFEQARAIDRKLYFESKEAD